MARLTLEKADAAGFKDSIALADRWFLANKPRSVLDAAAALLALPGSEVVKKRSVAFLHAAQGSDGGWGPHALSPSEPFDTALALLALQKINDGSGAVAKGRAFLMARQQPDGGWQETTRPPGGQSYAQRVSTSAWATLAL